MDMPSGSKEPTQHHERHRLYGRIRPGEIYQRVVALLRYQSVPMGQQDDAIVGHVQTRRTPEIVEIVGESSVRVSIPLSPLFGFVRILYFRYRPID